MPFGSRHRPRVRLDVGGVVARRDPPRCQAPRRTPRQDCPAAPPCGCLRPPVRDRSREEIQEPLEAAGPAAAITAGTATATAPGGSISTWPTDGVGTSASFIPTLAPSRRTPRTVRSRASAPARAPRAVRRPPSPASRTSRRLASTVTPSGSPTSRAPSNSTGTATWILAAPGGARPPDACAVRLYVERGPPHVFLSCRRRSARRRTRDGPASFAPNVRINCATLETPSSRSRPRRVRRSRSSFPAVRTASGTWNYRGRASSKVLVSSYGIRRSGSSARRNTHHAASGSDGSPERPVPAGVQAHERQDQGPSSGNVRGYPADTHTVSRF